MAKRISTVADLTPDARNANKGTERGRGMLETSLRDYGAGRSILADKHGTVIAGNKTLEAAADIGLKVREVHTTGEELVVVVRDDLDLETDKRARELAYADNRVGQIDLDFDADQMIADAEAGINIGKFWSEGELEALCDRMLEAQDGGQEASNAPIESKYMILIDCKSELEQTSTLDRLASEGYQCRALIS